MYELHSTATLRHDTSSSVNQSSLVRRAVIMELILLLFFISGGVYGQATSSTVSPGLNAEYDYVDIGEKYIAETKCIKKLYEIAKARWFEELANVPITDIDVSSKTSWEEKESNFTKYNNYEDEWLMADGSPVNKIEQCLRHVLSDVSAFGLNKNELDCITEISTDHVLHESYHQRDFETLINASSSEQLPFRKFISFSEIVDLIFQNRQVTDWTSIEGLLYEHTKSYVLSDADKDRPNYILTQNCDWVRLKALQDTRNELEMLGEFKSQVLRAVDHRLAARLINKWNLNKILPTERYSRWLESRKDMISLLEREVERLRNEPEDIMSLCKHVTEFAKNLTDVQSTILLTEKDHSANFTVLDATPDIRIIEQELMAINDSRSAAVKKIADKQEEQMRCLSSFHRLVENHRRYELATSFIDEEYEYPEIYCNGDKENPGLIQSILCNCIGTICVAHDLAALFEEEYVFVKNSDGLYKIVRSGIRSGRKVTHCHILANSSRN